VKPLFAGINLEMKVSSGDIGRAGAGRYLTSLCLLWIIGLAMRVALLAVPPVIPFIHADLHMSETQIGLLMGAPLAIFAIAAVPGSLLVARLGTRRTLSFGMLMAGSAAAGRGGAIDVTMLYVATVVMGLGIAIVQPAVPALVREWLPERPNLGTAACTNGMLVSTTLGPALTVPVVLPLVGGSWRLDLVVWAVPLLLVPVFILFYRPATPVRSKIESVGGRRWWPDWSDPLIWLLGLSFGFNNSIYFASNAFLPDYLARLGRGDLVADALTSLNAAQLLSSFLLMGGAERVLGRTWPYLVFGPLAIVALFGIVYLDGYWLVICAGILGFAIAVGLVMTLAAPPVLSPPGEVHRVAAGMFTIAYSCGVIVPATSGMLWDLTGHPGSAFAPLVLCAAMMTVFGVGLGRYSKR
jgi:MFS transporter, CP family, cyanate transporter